MSATAQQVPIALITGGAKRLGRAIALHLAKAGYRLVIHYHHAQREAEALCALIEAEGGRAAALSQDLGALNELPALMTKATSFFGPITLLVNNASLFGQDRAQTLQTELFSQNLAINLQAPVLLAKAFAEALPEGAEGAIINLIDQRVLRPNPQFFSYSLAKSALYTATKTLAQAYAPRIRVNGVGPGPTLPNIHEGAEGFLNEAAGTLLKIPVSPDAIAEAVLYLATARFVTGQMIAVDSGQHLGWQTPDIVDA
jgi:NAD(P)-dependent dehydrogenase (short-subunit alcohol dehydrogenase family)